MKRYPIFTFFFSAFFTVFTLTFPLVSFGNANDNSDITEIPYEAAEKFKVEILNNLTDRYNKLVVLDESAVHKTLVNEIAAQKKDIIAALQSSITEKALLLEAVEKVEGRMKELANKIYSLSKEQILENILISQEELTHLGAMNVLKGAVAVLATVALVPVFLFGSVLVTAGALVSIGTLGLLWPVGLGVILVGVAVCAGSIAGAAASWAWALDYE